MKRTSPNRALRAIVFTIAVVLLIGVVLLWRSTFSSLLWRALTPVLVHNPLSALASQFHSKAALAAENATLRAELASTTATLADRNLLYQENMDLKRRLGRDASVRSILAGVVMRPPGLPYDTLFIDAGAKEGVTQGDLVSAGGTTLIGTIDNVLDSSSRVVLFSAPGQSYQALLMQSDAHAVPVEVEGQGGGSLKTEVPANTNAGVGDVVIFPGVAGGLSSTVVAVDAKMGESFETLYLQLPANPQALHYVEVIEK